jgi:hypothetical protein
MTKTQIVVLWGLAVLVVVVFAVVSQVVTRRSEASVAVTPTPARVYSLGDGGSAKRLYAWADQAVRSLQGDAELASASTSWPFAAVEDLDDQVDWTFQFYSATTRRIYVVSVRESQATVLREALSPYALPTIAAEDWRTDSQQALSKWLSAGGGGFLDTRSVVDVSARLRHSETGRLVWIVAGVARGTQDAFVAQVDARGGQIVE